jgi:uncharacterized membrane protein
MTDWNQWLTRWAEAGLIDAEGVARIRDYETARAGSGKLRWPVLVAIAFGAVMLGGGVLLFVAAHWDALSPSARFAIVLTMVGGFHVAGGLAGDRVPHLSSALHGVGTIALGAGIALAGQIFNLDEHWPSGILMWAVGAGAGWILLRQTPQAALLAILTPAWLFGESYVATSHHSYWITAGATAAGLCLVALTYFTLSGRPRRVEWETALRWVGGISLLPAALALSFEAAGDWTGRTSTIPPPSPTVQTIIWLVAIGGPLALAAVVRRQQAWPHAAAALWMVALLFVEPGFGRLAPYGWWLVGAIGLVAWGVRDGDSPRVNMGAAIFAGTVAAFYFSQVMDKLGRSASLIGLGLLFLAGGWALDRVRRRLVLQARGIA